MYCTSLPEGVAAARLPMRPSPCDAVKRHTDPAPPEAVTRRHKLHVNQSPRCPEVVRYTISKTALQPFVNVICLIALYAVYG